MPHDVLIIGASTRAAAFSAIRCGLRPRCVDYFADRDLAQVCTVDRVDPEAAPDQFVALAESIPPTPWFYTGGLENRPECVEQIARKHPLWGMNAQILHAIRDPIAVSAALAEAGLPTPEVRLDSARLPRDGSWLRKPLKSAGGWGISPLTSGQPESSTSCYFQQRIAGPSFSALFVGHGATATLKGVTRQWLGIDGNPFVYRGSIGPWPIGHDLESRLQALGNRLVAAFRLVGWFGVDYILNEGQPWPVEVNPRYTASLEVHELATGQSLLDAHRRACEKPTDTVEPPQGQPPPLAGRPRPAIAKRIVYAPHTVIAPDIPVDENEDSGPFALRSIADIPWPGALIAAGEPVMTLLAAGADVDACERALERLEQEWRARLRFASTRASANRT